LNASTRYHALTEALPLEDHPENAPADHAPQQVDSDEQSRSRSAEESDASDEGGCQTFIDGAGI
jgi:hypothetical protein